MSYLNNLDGLDPSGPGEAGPWNVSVSQPWWQAWALDEHGEGVDSLRRMTEGRCHDRIASLLGVAEGGRAQTLAWSTEDNVHIRTRGGNCRCPKWWAV